MNIAVIGGGAAGMLAAGVAARAGAQVLLIEKNEKLGKKVYITGKGRCNVTNAARGDEFLACVPRNPRFIMSALSRFDSADTREYLAQAGLETVVERGGRVFPASFKASDVTRALARQMERYGAQTLLNASVSAIETREGRVAAVLTGERRFPCDAAIVCTGGVSYPATGSTGDGYIFARETGHRIVAPLPALAPVTTGEGWVRALAGLTLKNVRLRAVSGKKRLYDELGEMLFTHTGVSGPLVLTLSSIITGMDYGAIELFIDLKPGLDEAALEKRVLRDFEQYKNKQLINAMRELMPQSLIPVVIAQAGAQEQKSVNQLSRQERQGLVRAMKGLRLTVRDVGPIAEAVVTRGGVHTGDIDPRTMESKKVSGLYFAGEVIDIDGFTGGFNLQLAFTSAHCAALAAAGQI